MKTSTNKEIKGWSNIYAPKSVTVKVADWLSENGLEDDAKNITPDASFADFSKFIQGKDKYGAQIVDVESCELEYCNGRMDSFLRDVIYDALGAVVK